MINHPKHPKTFSRPSARLFALLIFAPVLAACASGPASAAALSTEQQATAEHACTQSMGLKPGYTDYQACVLSLQQTLTSVNEAQLVQRKRELCAARGYTPGTREFAVCVVSTEKTAAAQ